MERRKDRSAGMRGRLTSTTDEIKCREGGSARTTQISARHTYAREHWTHMRTIHMRDTRLGTYVLPRGGSLKKTVAKLRSGISLEKKRNFPACLLFLRRLALVGCLGGWAWLLFPACLDGLSGRSLFTALPWWGAGLRSFLSGLRPFPRSSSSGFLSMTSMGTCPVARSWIRRFSSRDIFSFSPADAPPTQVHVLRRRYSK